MTRPRIVIKVGGSLLANQQALRVVRDVFAARPDAHMLLVIGGGGAADVVRQWDETFALGEERAHWLALNALELTQALWESLWPGLRPVRSVPQFESACRDNTAAILCAGCFARWAERQGHIDLPHSWEATTDSLAAWVARLVGADELILIKSCALPTGLDISRAAQENLTDERFPVIARHLATVSWVNGLADPVSVVPAWHAGQPPVREDHCPASPAASPHIAKRT